MNKAKSTTFDLHEPALLLAKEPIPLEYLQTTGAVNGDVLTYNSITDNYEPMSGGGGGGIGGGGTLNSIPRFTPDGVHIGDSIMSQGSGTINVNGSISVPTNQLVAFNGVAETVYFTYDGTKLRTIVGGDLSAEWEGSLGVSNIYSNLIVGNHSAFGGSAIDMFGITPIPILLNVGQTFTSSTDLYGVASFITANPSGSYTSHTISAMESRTDVTDGNTQDFSGTNMASFEGTARYGGVHVNPIQLVKGASFDATNTNTGTIGTAIGVGASVFNNQGGNITNAIAVLGDTENELGGNITGLAVGIAGSVSNNGLGNIGTAAAMVAQTASNAGGGGIGTLYGLLIQDQSGVPNTPVIYNLLSQGSAATNAIEGHTTLGANTPHSQSLWVEGPSILHGGGQLDHDNGSLSIDWQNDSMRDGTTGFPSINWFNRVLFTSTFNVVSLDWNSRTLYDQFGTGTVDWDNKLLRGSSNTTTLDWENKQLDSAAGNPTVDWENMRLRTDTALDPTGYSVLWSDRTLNVGSGVRLDWNTNVVNDSLGANSMSWETRLLKDSTGSNTSVDWQNRVLYNAAATIQTVDWDGTTLFANPGGFGTVNWTTMQLSNTSGLVAKWAVAAGGAAFHLEQVPTYADDATATGAGLVTGDLYKTTTGGSTFLKIVP